MRITAVLMLKAPRPGFVKTRLAAELGSDRATEIYRNLVEHQLSQIPPSWRCSIHFAPADGESEMRQWLDAFSPELPSYHAQCEGDLGARLRHAVRIELDRGADAVVLMGGDCPELDSPALLTVGQALPEADVVIAHAADGGYVLLGVKADHPSLFEGIPWSTPEVGELTLKAAGAAGLRVHRMGPYVDIDDLASLATLTEATLV